MTDDPFRSMVRTEGVRLYRDLPWRRTRDPYVVWLSEVMLQQTQVRRVLDRMPAWLERFPDVEMLAAAAPADVLEAWQGMGYNRRALALHAAAVRVVGEYGATFPCETADLLALPGIGPSTAQGIRSFAFDLPGVYLETNVRTVFLHHFFPETPNVSDKELIPLIEANCPASSGVGHPGVYAVPLDEGDTPRAWYYALLDYGAYLKKVLPNPSRRSSGYHRQSKFEGSRRQKRAELVRLLLAERERRGAAGETLEERLGRAEGALTLDEVTEKLSTAERKAGRADVDRELVRSILNDLVKEGFCIDAGDVWRIA